MVINVLDHGYVKVVGTMGTEETIVEAARMSSGKGFISWDPYPDGESNGVQYKGRKDGDTGFLGYLYRNKHMTPFEMCELSIEVQAPIFVFREWHRHRTQSYNEFSARYAEMPDLHYVPEPNRFQKQSTANKQGSGEPFSEKDQEFYRGEVQDQQNQIYGLYSMMLGNDMAKEVARINTPVSRYSKMRAKANLRNWLGFLQLRRAPSAQWEIRQYADAVGTIIKSVWPRTYSLFLEHDFYSVHLSSTESMLLQEAIDWDKITNEKLKEVLVKKFTWAEEVPHGEATYGVPGSTTDK